MATKKVTKKVSTKGNGLITTEVKELRELHKAQKLEKLRDEKFGTNPFAQSYQEDLEQSGFVDEIMEGAEQVKSWSRHERAGVYDQIARSIIMFLLGVIIGLVIMGI